MDCLLVTEIFVLALKGAPFTARFNHQLFLQKVCTSSPILSPTSDTIIFLPFFFHFFPAVNVSDISQCVVSTHICMFSVLFTLKKQKQNNNMPKVRVRLFPYLMLYFPLHCAEIFIFSTKQILTITWHLYVTFYVAWCYRLCTLRDAVGQSNRTCTTLPHCLLPQHSGQWEKRRQGALCGLIGEEDRLSSVYISIQIYTFDWT